MAEKIKKTKKAGKGAGLQFLGVVLIVVSFLIGFADVGILAGSGFVLLIYGGLSANVHICSECRAEVDKKAKICPHCRSDF